MLNLPTARATEYSSSNFKILDPVIVPGAGFSTSSGFQLWTSIGQEAIGLSNSVNFGLRGGFLYFPAPVSIATTAGEIVRPAAPFTRILPIKKITLGLICDFNEDGLCNIIDFSILLFYFGKPVTPATARFDLNGDGRIGLVDVSILFFYWV